MAEDNKEIFDFAKERWDQTYTYYKEETAKAIDDLKFGINDEDAQWDADLKSRREAEFPPRPCLVVNKIPEKIDQVEGEFRQAKPGVTVRPVDDKGDVIVAEILSGIHRHIEYNSNARAIYNSAFTTTLYAGLGGAWMINTQDCDDNPWEREIVIEPIRNGFAVYDDPMAKKSDHSDRKYLFIVEDILQKQYEKDYPGKPIESWDKDDESWTGWRSENTVRVALYYWVEEKKEKKYRVLVDGKPVIVDKKEDLAPDLEFEERDIVKKTVKYCKMTKYGIIEGPEDWPGKYIPVVTVTGKSVTVDGKVKSRGMVRFAKTPQQLFNYFESAEAEQVSLAPKAPYLVTPHMIGNHQDVWNNAASKNYFYLPYDPDPQAPNIAPRREPPPGMSTAINNELIRQEHDIMAAMGIYQAGLGDQTPEKSGVAIQSRQKQGNIGTFAFSDNMADALQFSAKIIIDLIPYVYDTERVARIRGEDDIEKRVPINATPDSPIMNTPNLDQKMISPSPTKYINDLSAGKYDVVVTIGPSYATQRQQALDMLIELVQRFPQAGMAIIDLVVKNMDIPQGMELVKRLKKLVPIEVRGLEPGEEPPNKEPSLEETIAFIKADIERREMDRKEFETQVKAITDVMKAEAVERGSQFEEFRGILEELRLNMQDQQQGPAGPGQGQPVQNNQGGTLNV